MKEYLKKIYESRYFWLHLARIELKNKFRRSKLGILWTFINPLCMTAIMAAVFSIVFHQDLVTYAPYILSGILFWDMLNSSLIGGGFTIIGNESYIRQFSHPITIYMLKSAIVYIISFLIALISLILWVAIIAVENLPIAFISLPLTILIFFVLIFSSTTIAAYTNTKYRDYPQMVPLILQTLWYLSPVFFQEDMFKQNEFLYTWFNCNPITHILMLIRKPFLEGQYPSTTNYLVSIGTVLLLAILAYRCNKKNSNDIIFYI
nr:ABC transporter permease [uncultured Aminipila sp.]